MLVGVDRAQKTGQHDLKHRQLISLGHKLISIPIPVGDYIKITPEIWEVIKRRGKKLKKIDLIGLIDVSVDTKKDCSELYSDIVQDHSRFHDEYVLAQNNKIKLIILVENTEGITSIDDFDKWENKGRWKTYHYNKRIAEANGEKPPKPPMDTETLKKAMRTISEKYGVEFMFCNKNETGAIIEKLLEG